MKDFLVKVGAVVLLSVGLLACGTTSTADINAQALADAQGLVNTTKAIVAAIELNDPAAFSAIQQAQITASMNAANAALAQLSAGTLALPGATTLQTIDTDINAVLAAAGAALPAAAVAFPALAPTVPLYDAAVALLPLIEAYVNTVIENTQVTPNLVAAAEAPLKPIQSHYDADQARKLLGVAQVSK